MNLMRNLLRSLTFLVFSVVAPGLAAAQSSSPLICFIDDRYVPCEESTETPVNSTNATQSSINNVTEVFTQQQINTAQGLAIAGGPTGKLRHTSHDGLVNKATGERLESFDIDEGSVFANGSYDVPGTVMGGKVRISVLVGYDEVQQDSASASSETSSVFYGGSWLWSYNTLYTSTLIVGINGELDGRAGGNNFSYDVDGYISNSVIGNTFDLGQVKFDLRGGLGSSNIDGGRFALGDGFTSTDYSNWNASVTGTLFTIVNLSGGGVMRPYVLASYKRVFDEDIELNLQSAAASLTLQYEQAQDFGKGEIGFDVVDGQFTYGAAVYTEFSSDEETIGGRLGISVKLQ